MATKVAVVTGSNKGIGYAIVRGLCKRFEGIVYLTSRDIERGKKAVADLEKEGLNPKYHQLDITNKQSVETFRDYIKSKYEGIDILVNNAAIAFKNSAMYRILTVRLIIKYEGIDILVNNAAIAFKNSATEPVAVQAEQTLFVNYFSLVSACEILFPILKNGARVVNVSSSSGHLSNIPSKELRDRLKDEKLTIPELTSLVQQYVDAAKQGTHAAQWGNSSYVVSKVGVTALSNIQQRMLENRDIKVNSVHPGYVDTDMTSHKGPLSIDEGAAAPLYLALDAPDSIKGKYVWYNKKIVDWEGQKPVEA